MWVKFTCQSAVTRQVKGSKVVQSLVPGSPRNFWWNKRKPCNLTKWNKMAGTRTNMNGKKMHVLDFFLQITFFFNRPIICRLSKRFELWQGSMIFLTRSWLPWQWSGRLKVLWAAPDRERLQTNFAAFRRHLHPGAGGEAGHLRAPPIILHLLLLPPTNTTLASEYKVESGWSAREFIVCLGPKGWPQGPLEPSHLPLCSKFNPSHSHSPPPHFTLASPTHPWLSASASLFHIKYQILASN